MMKRKFLFDAIEENGWSVGRDDRGMWSVKDREGRQLGMHFSLRWAVQASIDFVNSGAVLQPPGQPQTVTKPYSVRFDGKQYVRVEGGQSAHSILKGIYER